VDLVVDHPDVVVENVHLADSLMQLSYNTVKKERM
jgi:redox-sensing transcriptional repressor